METIEKLAAIPLPVWIGLIVFIVIFVIFIRGTNAEKAKPDYKVSKPEGDLWYGSPHADRSSDWNHNLNQPEQHLELKKRVREAQEKRDS